MSDDASEVVAELPQMWQYIHPTHNSADSSDDEADEEENADVTDNDAARGGRPADYVKLKKSAPRLGQLIRFLNDMEDEDVQGLLLENDPVTRQTLLQWATLNNHFMLVEYLVKRMKRAAFSFDAESVEVVVYDRWAEMSQELPTAAEVAERQKQRENEKAKRLAERAMANSGDDVIEDEESEEEEEVEPMPEELVYDTLEDYHGELGDGGVGVVKRIGELGVYVGPRLPDGTKQGLGQTLFPSGDCYTGEYKENQRDGRGVYWWSKGGALYCGEWFRNMRHGYGRMVYPDGSRYLGRWVHGKRSGKGRYVYADGSSYDGAWVKDEKHGSGTYHLLDGSSFIGTFHHNRFVSGEWRLASGTVRYIGNFENDAPAGAGVYVHRCGLKPGTFQQEGTYSAEGKSWVPSMLKCTSRMVPHIELVVPPQPSGSTRVPMEFGAECTGRTMADLIKVANYAPLLRWVASLTSAAKDLVVGEVELKGVELRGVEVQTMRYDAADPDAITEVTILPILVDNVGKRVRPPSEAVTLKPSVTRLMVLLEAPGTEPVVLLEKSLQSASPDEHHQQSRLPAVRISEDSSVGGDVVDAVGPALRLQLASTNSMALLLPPMRCNPMQGNAEESVWMYAQEVHRETVAQLEHKLELLSAELPEASTTYVAVPLSDVTSISTDAMTAMAAANVQQRRAAQTLPRATVAPQRPPTPPPPTLEPRPELQPLYDAKARRDEAELEE
ncbi:Phosphatidylinositol 4-phosphate 5-kinase, putative [Leishmania donovani]|uniref:Phosphatidylinositol 4-phosphate 5-kinase, putative n=1 Tax=Leishmania donovani TaxID=5661 RepID=A0A3S5H5L8_LEIDO|nr:Phosphatidylinositol 4-phosphate 5-kinase, putative [Leishmania donovani]